VTYAGSAYIHVLADLKALGRLKDLPDLVFGYFVFRKTKLFDDTDWLLSGLLKSFRLRFVYQFLALVPEPEHERGVAIFTLGTRTEYYTRADENDGYRYNVPVF
jgi:hypothetical protein